MGNFPLAPRVLTLSPVPSVMVFQYNPETVTRTLQAQASGDGGARSKAMRLATWRALAVAS